MTLDSVLIVFIFTTLNEALIEYFIGNIIALKPYLPLLSLATAILLTFGFNLSLFSVFLNTPIQYPFWEFLLSAFVVARLSNFINDFSQKLLGGK